MSRNRHRADLEWHYIELCFANLRSRPGTSDSCLMPRDKLVEKTADDSVALALMLGRSTDFLILSPHTAILPVLLQADQLQVCSSASPEQSSRGAVCQSGQSGKETVTFRAPGIGRAC